MIGILDDVKIQDTKVQSEIDMRKKYQSLFMSQMGREVLEDMLWDLKFLDECKDAGDMALNNYAKKLLGLIYGNEIESSTLQKILSKLVRKKHAGR